MQQHLQNLENWLDAQYKKLPDLPKGGKDFLVDAAPWLSLIGGIVNLWAAWTIWEWARYANRLMDYANTLSEAFGMEQINSRWTLAIWLSLLLLVVTAVMYLMAFSQLKDRKKAGWNLLFYAALLNVVYGAVAALSDYSSFGSLIGSIIGTAIVLYFLFQIRSNYSETKASAAAKPAKPPKS